MEIKSLNRFAGQSVIITGGSRGIGKEIAERFLTEGANVYIVDYVLPAENEPMFDNADFIARTSLYQADVSKEESVVAAFEAIIKKAGRVDVLVNNAGITRDNLILRMPEKDWDAVINTNLKGTFNCCKAIAKQMMGQRAGRIINIGSVVGAMGNAGQVNYSASKAGMLGITRSLAKELGSRGVLVNLVAPGFVITHMTNVLTEEQKAKFLEDIPLRRAATPRDIANVVSFLASEDASYLTGQEIFVDGGMTL